MAGSDAIVALPEPPAVVASEPVRSSAARVRPGRSPVRALLVGVPPADGGTLVLGDHDAEALLEEADLGRAIPALAEAVRVGQVQLPAATNERLAGLDRVVQETSLFIERTANRAIELLERQGIEPVVIKGLATGHLDHAGPHLRQIGDVDLLVGPDELETAAAVLADAGFTLTEREGEGRAAKSLTMRSGQGVEVDLHRLPTRWRYGRWVLDQPVPTETIDVSSVPWRVLPRADRFVLAVVHYVQDGRRLSSVGDAIALWPTPDERTAWAEAVRRWDAAVPVAAFRAMVEAGSGITLDPIPGCDPHRGRWLGRALAAGGASAALANRAMAVGDLPPGAALRDVVRFAFPDRQWMARSTYPSRRARYAHGVRVARTVLRARGSGTKGGATTGSVR